MGILINNDPVLKINRHPILIDHETQIALDLKPGESLEAFLHRHIDNMDGHKMAVTVGGKKVKREMWRFVFPKANHNIVVRFGVEKTALLVIALIALTVFTMGAATGVAAIAAGGTATGIGAGLATGLAAAGLSATASMAVIGAIQVVGAMIINKVLGPKPPKPASVERDSVYNISGARNSVRQYEPVGLLFGSVRVTPDIFTIPYTFYQGNDQYLAMVLSPGINVDRVDTLYLGDTLLSTYQGVQTWFADFPGMPQQEIPLFTNVDTIAGGKLEAPYGAPGEWMTRSTSLDTVRIQLDFSFLLFDLTSKGKKKMNSESVQVQYKLQSESAWNEAPVQPAWRNDSQTEQRRTYGWVVPRGQYDVRVRRKGLHTNGSGATAEINWANLLSIQADDADYRGLPRIGLQIKATSQLSGSPDEVRAIMHARAMPFWNGAAWVTATVANGGLSNPGAQALQYARGFYDDKGALIAGMGLPDAQIDIESFKSFMNHCRINGFTYNQWLSDARTHDEIVSTIMLAAMGRYSWSPGRFTALWAWEGQGHEGVATMANIKKGDFQIDYTLMQAADGIEYTYIDGQTWEPKTLRVPSPGVETMLNPARLTGEGINTEAQAAILARYHMGQSLYQFKDIVFSMDMEYLSFGQMSVIQLSHDITQWGYSGRLLEASRDGQGRVTLRFDTPVPSPGAGITPYVGLRIAGEANFRVMQIAPFAGEKDVVQLVNSWPADAAFPGNNANNPVFDTLYLYDFKATPGLRCRVTGIRPGEDLGGASISVVPETDEFWNFVRTGEYIPPKSGSLLRPQPTVSNLRVREERVVQGDTVFSTFNATWDISGFAKYVIVTCAADGQPAVEVARTSARSASWRVDDPGQYIITVRPFDENEVPGVSQALVYEAFGANQPPVNADLFFVDEVPGGVRKYSWGWRAETIQSPDFAGVEIRYIEGSVATPSWDLMTPLSLDGETGDPGFHTAAFETTVPVSGQWTFALRARNTSGVLSDTMITVDKVLAYNLGERFVEVDQVLSRHEENLLQQIEDIAENSAAIVKQAQAQYQIQDEQRAHRGYIARLDEVKVDADGAKAIATEIVSAQVGDLRAAVQTNSEAIVGMDGQLSATWSVKAQITENGKYHLAGISVGVYPDGDIIQKEVIVLANEFEILSDDAFGNVYRPFRVENGVVFMNSAMIQDGTITNAKIGNVLQSSNFVWNPAGNEYAGWKLDKSGSAYFAGDITIRGNVLADSLTGLLQRTVSWTYDGYLSPNDNGVTTNFVLDAPTRAGDTHTPLLTIELTMSNGPDHGRDGYVVLERATGTGWVTVRSKYYLLSSSANITNIMIVRDVPTAVANTYRIRVMRGTSAWGSWGFQGAYVTMQGVR